VTRCRRTVEADKIRGVEPEAEEESKSRWTPDARSGRIDRRLVCGPIRWHGFLLDTSARQCSPLPRPRIRDVLQTALMGTLRPERRRRVICLV